jgi:hypothetical protein
MAKPPTSIFHHGHGTSSSPPSDSLTTSPRGQSTSTAQKSEVKSSGRNSMPRNSSSCPPRKHDFMADWDSDWDTLSQGIPGRNRRTKTDGRLNAWCFDMEEKMTQKQEPALHHHLPQPPRFRKPFATACIAVDSQPSQGQQQPAETTAGSEPRKASDFWVPIDFMMKLGPFIWFWSSGSKLLMVLLVIASIAGWFFPQSDGNFIDFHL